MSAEPGSMKRARTVRYRRLAAGTRHALLSPMAREEVRALMIGEDADNTLDVSALIMRALWIMLVSDHVAQHNVVPSEPDCEGYRLFAELCMGDAVDAIDQRVRDCTAQRGQAADPFLQEARSLKRFADEISAREDAQLKQSIKEIRQRALTFTSFTGPPGLASSAI
jgi:hypothetical protein